MKSSNKLKAITLILVIVLITILSFLGVYDITKVHGDNLVKDYKVGMDLSGKNLIRLKVDDTVNKVIYDSEGKKVEKKEENGNYTEVEEPANLPEVLNKENYKKSVSIMEDRLKSMGATEYKIRFNEENGIIEIELIEDELTDYIINAISQKGDFKITDSETNETLLDKNHIKSVKVMYGTSQAGTTLVGLDIEFNKEGSKKLDELNETYVEKTETVVNDEGESEEKQVGKQVSIKIDEEITIGKEYLNNLILQKGHIYVSEGEATTNTRLIATLYAAIIDTDTIPVLYTIDQSEFIVTNTNKNIIPTVAIIALIVEIVVCVAMFRIKGIIASILQIGYVALLLLVLKCANVFVTVEGLFAIVLISIINVIFIFKVLFDTKNGENIETAVNNNLVKFIKLSIPALITVIIFCFIQWLEVKSFGMIMFWGYAVSILYNILFTKGIFKNIFKR